VSFLHPDITLAAGLDRTGAIGAITALASLRPELAAALVGSAEPAPADDAAARSRVLTHGVPVVWTYAATETGVMVGYPGTGRYPPDYDPRTTPWYTAGLMRREPGWGRPYLDESGMGLLIGCGVALRNRAGEPVGVAGLDVTVRGLVDAWLTPGELDAEGFLVGDDNTVMVRSRGGNTPTAEGTPFPWPEVLTAMRASPGGQAVIGEQFAAWSKLHAVPWTYVVVGSAELGG